jgi:hypothetical protein
MRRRRNWLIWAGLVIAILATVSYVPVFSRFPSTRDTAWANFALFAIAGVLLGLGVHRAFASPEVYRGKIGGPILALLSLGLFSLFTYGIVVATRLPSGAGALRAGDQAPEFTLLDTNNNSVSLAALRAKSRAVLVIFYRGHW